MSAAVWDQILEPVAQMRSSSGTLKLFPVYLKGEDLFGLTTSAVTRIIESVRHAGTHTHTHTHIQQRVSMSLD